ncbi:PssD/Cps14F family polysaccharide biosynthesis glycosyltransferase [Pedobacter alpinus]|uniref:PssD/Cps14F family polysaccharide biosynthesis glycosyltransferase n=1 Tax=Pedobacter alpinus TaxID=1590643 RepID=A0ABW5TTR3_9SPHI
MNKDTKVLFASSAGGHLDEVLQLEELRSKYEYLLVTEELESTKALKEKYNVKYIRPDVMGRGVKYIWSILVNFYLSFFILISFKPKVIITTGSHTAFPMCVLGKLMGIKIIYILSYARVNSKAKTANLVYPFADLFLVQWESAQKLYPKSIYKGGLF